MTRTAESIAFHYRVEKDLAAKLRNAPRQERRALYSAVYDELLDRVVDHPTKTRSTKKFFGYHRWMLEQLKPADVYLEVGPGDCGFALRAAERAGKVFAVDVASVMQPVSAPKNFEFMLSDGCSIPVAPGSVDCVFSDQLMEHLHPDDAMEQLANIFQALKPGGFYFCVTPNRLNGPHDISRAFDKTASGLHLREYSTGDLAALFKQVGFHKIRALIGLRGKYFPVPLSFMLAIENMLSLLPSPWLKQPQLNALISVRLIGIKP